MCIESVRKKKVKLIHIITNRQIIYVAVEQQNHMFIYTHVYNIMSRELYR